MKRRMLLLTAAIVAIWSGRPQTTAQLQSELVFPLEHWHNHASTIVEAPNGDLIVCWYHGSGEREADDVVIRGARLKKGAKAWSEPFLMADTPGYPDGNPTMFIDPRRRLWLLWPVILSNQWESALMKYKISSDYARDGAPRWDVNEVLHVTPSEEFTTPSDKLARRLGWMTRAHPIVLDGTRLIVPLYSDRFSFSLMAITDDWGATWKTSTPLVGRGNIQPSIARAKDGTLVTYMRDNGPPPKRLHISRSRDRGDTWSPVQDSDLPNPGSGAEVITLANGHWVLAYNDLEQGRYSLAVSLSEDDGATWPWTRHLERDPQPADPQQRGEYHYPSIIQAADGTLHASYSYFIPPAQAKRDDQGRLIRKAIKHAHFDEDWIRAK